MKTLIASFVAVLLVSGAAAPSFAASLTDPNDCVFKDSSLCQSESSSLSPESNDVSPAPVKKPQVYS